MSGCLSGWVTNSKNWERIIFNPFELLVGTLRLEWECLQCLLWRQALPELIINYSGKNSLSFNTLNGIASVKWAGYWSLYICNTFLTVFDVERKILYLFLFIQVQNGLVIEIRNLKQLNSVFLLSTLYSVF